TMPFDKEGWPSVQQTVQELAALVGGKVHGDGAQTIRTAKPLHDARAGDVTFVENERYVRMLAVCQASAVVVSDALAGQFPDLLMNLPGHFSVIQVADALASFIAIAQHLRGNAGPESLGIDPRAAVHPAAQIGPDCSIHPFAVIGEGAVLGARCRVYS